MGIKRVPVSILSKKLIDLNQAGSSGNPELPAFFMLALGTKSIVSVHSRMKVLCGRWASGNRAILFAHTCLIQFWISTK